MLGAAAQLKELGFTVDAVESRAWVNGLSFVETLGSQDRLPETMIIHLGTNGPIGQSNMDRMMAAVSTVPTVLLVTNDVDRDYTAGNNELIFAAAAANPNVKLLDWQGFTASCPGDCFEADGFHLKPDGRNYYAQLSRAPSTPEPGLTLDPAASGSPTRRPKRVGDSIVGPNVTILVPDDDVRPADVSPRRREGAQRAHQPRPVSAGTRRDASARRHRGDGVSRQFVVAAGWVPRCRDVLRHLGLPDHVAAHRGA